MKAMNPGAPDLRELYQEVIFDHNRKPRKHFFEVHAHFCRNIGQISLDIAVCPAMFAFE